MFLLYQSLFCSAPRRGAIGRAYGGLSSEFCFLFSHPSSLDIGYSIALSRLNCLSHSRFFRLRHRLTKHAAKCQKKATHVSQLAPGWGKCRLAMPRNCGIRLDGVPDGNDFKALK